MSGPCSKRQPELTQIFLTAAWRREQSCFHSDRARAIDIGLDVIEEDRFRGNETKRLRSMAEDGSVRLQQTNLSRNNRSFEKTPELMARLEVRDDLVDVVGQSKNPIAGLFEPLRDIFRAIDQVLVVRHMEEEIIGLLL